MEGLISMAFSMWLIAWGRFDWRSELSARPSHALENSGSIMVSMFDVDNDYQANRRDIPPSYKGNDNDIPF